MLSMTPIDVAIIEPQIPANPRRSEHLAGAGTQIRPRPDKRVPTPQKPTSECPRPPTTRRPSAPRCQRYDAIDASIRRLSHASYSAGFAHESAGLAPEKGVRST
jgi:hypothetical protein